MELCFLSILVRRQGTTERPSFAKGRRRLLAVVGPEYHRADLMS